MSIFRRRLVKPDDVKCVEQHLKQFEHHYGGIDSDDRLELLKSLLKEQVVTGLMLENTSAASEPQIVGIGITGFLSLQSAEQLMAHPDDAPVVDKIYAQEIAGQPVLLRPTQIANKNSGEGLALMFLHFSLPAGDPSSAETQQAVELMQSSFRMHHGGYDCRMALHPVPQGDPRAKESMLNMGFQLVGEGEYLLLFDFKVFEQAPFHPFNCLQRKRLPRIGFSPAEKDLLNLALWGNNDSDIANTLNITVDTVRKRWRRIFEKIEDHPEVNLFSDAAQERDKGTRGPEKRSVVIQFIDAHLEEIRPYERV
jgi:DNA-binding CsgD family transcriptional regulator